MTAFRFVSMVPCVVLMTATTAAAQGARSVRPFDNGYMTAPLAHRSVTRSP
jgi:hypothetical protein